MNPVAFAEALPRVRLALLRALLFTSLLLLGTAQARTQPAVADGPVLEPALDTFAARRSGALQVLNFRSGTTVTYPLVLLRGEVAAAEGEPLTVRNLSAEGADSEFHTTVQGGRFKALMELVPGTNRLVLSTSRKRTNLNLRYRPATSPYVVRFIYFTDASGDTTYQSERPDDPQDYAAKLDTAAKLMQSFTAERLYERGYGRKTFNLELDEQGKVQVHVLRGPQPAEYYYGLSDLDLYFSIGTTVNQELPAPTAKNVVLPAFSRFDPATGQVRGHTALGGGNLALFGSTGLFTWPSRWQDTQLAFTDPTPIDPTRTHDDSVGRSTYWALASTTMGATLHELGHTLDLPHSPDPWDIMSRGFDYLNRAFTLVEPPHAGRPSPYVFAPSEEATWGPVNAPRLAYHRWLQAEAQNFRDFPPPTLRLEPDGETITIEATYGIRVIGIDAEGLSRDSLVFPKVAPRRVVYTRSQLAQRAGSAEFGLRVIDGQGNHTYVNLSDLVDASRFVRAWQFAPQPVAWPSPDAFVPVSDSRLEMLNRQLARQPLQEGTSPYVDLIPWYTPATDQRVTYAYRTLRVDTDLPVHLLTGSDDSLRVWINGELVVSRLVLRGASPDQETTPALLRRGKNTVLVEVSNWGGGWGFYFRLTDTAGRPLGVSATGQVQPLPVTSASTLKTRARVRHDEPQP